MGQTLRRHGLPKPQSLHARAPAERCSLTVKVDRLKRFHARVDAPPAPGPVSDPGQEGEHEVSCCSTARLSGTSHTTSCCGTATRRRTTSGSEELLHCPQKVAAYEATVTRTRRPSARPSPAGAAVPPAPQAPRPYSLRCPVAPAGRLPVGVTVGGALATAGGRARTPARDRDGVGALRSRFCICGKGTVGCRGGSAACAGGTASRTCWVAPPLRRSALWTWN
jgi:hypothetical protein